jgi:enoyl-CoA hydratase
MSTSTDRGYPYDFISYEVDREAKIATLTFTRPDAGNAAPWWADAELIELIDEWESDDDVKCVLIRGQGRDFCVGHDFGEYLTAGGIRGGEDARRRSTNRQRYVNQRKLSEFHRRLLLSLKPTIAVVQGHCIEWACILQALCDITIAAEDAHFGCLGQTAGNSGVHYLPIYISLIGHKRAREMFITGRTVSGHDAALIGLANRAVPAAELEAEAENEARRIALLPIDGIVLGKAYAEAALDSFGLTQGLPITNMAWMLGLRVRFEDDEFGFLNAVREEGVGAALEKRKKRYDAVGGYGRHAERPIVSTDASADY